MSTVDTSARQDTATATAAAAAAAPASNLVADIVAMPPPVHSAALLPMIDAQSRVADATRTIDPQVIAALKASPILSLAASGEIGGLGAGVAEMGVELAAIAAACSSTAWCLWNHWSVFHLFCGALGPDHVELLAGIVAAGQWVCFPAGAGSRVFGRTDGDDIVLHGPATFGSGSRYADWSGVAFALGDGSRPPTPDELRFTIVDLNDPAVSIDPSWDGASLRASATDTICYDDLRVPAARTTPWFAANRAAAFRDPALPMIHGRYREDWVGLSDIWLAYMAVGVLRAALADAVAEISERRRHHGLGHGEVRHRARQPRRGGRRGEHRSSRH